MPEERPNLLADRLFGEGAGIWTTDDPTPQNRAGSAPRMGRVLRHRDRRVSGYGVPPGTVESERPRAG